jgi:hypothetical protein
MNRTIYPLLVFVGAALVGPLLRGLTWPLLLDDRGKMSGVWEYAEKLVYDVVFLLWPTQMLGVVERSTGKSAALFLAIGGNILLFVIVGAVIVAATRKMPILLAAYFLLFVGIIFLALWGAGFDYDFLNVGALSIALVFYIILMFLVQRVMKQA